ncbi:hypothetical protein GmarT_48270 [Gimesia maris]|uniref:Uncharacterized protein n=1 Tax=Gimesia maris TaxID=122 RepID=A0ABX5YTK4_9PLAN|nr:hypothetical protein GmarT_48270 [Gimesia maris]
MIQVSERLGPVRFKTEEILFNKNCTALPGNLSSYHSTIDSLSGGLPGDRL